MTLVFLPLVLLGPVMMLIVAVLALASHGPVGWLAAVALVVFVVLASRWLVRVTCAWWASTKAPERHV